MKKGSCGAGKLSNLFFLFLALPIFLFGCMPTSTVQRTRKTDSWIAKTIWRGDVWVVEEALGGEDDSHCPDVFNTEPGIEPQIQNLVLKEIYKKNQLMNKNQIENLGFKCNDAVCKYNEVVIRKNTGSFKDRFGDNIRFDYEVCVDLKKYPPLVTGSYRKL